MAAICELNSFWPLYALSMHWTQLKIADVLSKLINKLLPVLLHVYLFPFGKQFYSQLKALSHYNVSANVCRRMK